MWLITEGDTEQVLRIAPFVGLAFGISFPITMAWLERRSRKTEPEKPEALTRVPFDRFFGFRQNPSEVFFSVDFCGLWRWLCVLSRKGRAISGQPLKRLPLHG